MSCKKCALMMSDYLGDCLPGHVRLEFEVHVESCTQCAAELAALENMLESLRSLCSGKAPVNCWHGVKSKIHEQHATKQKTRPWLFRPMYAMPAFALVMALILLLVLPGFISDQHTNDLVSIPEYSNYISAHSRAQRQQVLSDPHVTFITAELEKASLTTDSVAP
ncbi:MAG: anti-sigma factor [Armatimonadota bacterium]